MKDPSAIPPENHPDDSALQRPATLPDPTPNTSLSTPTPSPIMPYRRHIPARACKAIGTGPRRHVLKRGKKGTGPLTIEDLYREYTPSTLIEEANAPPAHQPEREAEQATDNPRADHLAEEREEQRESNPTGSAADQQEGVATNVGELGADVPRTVDPGTPKAGNTSHQVSGPRLLWLKDILSEPIQPVTWDAEPVISRGSRNMFFGEFGALKSWLLLDLGLHLQAGMPWLRHFPIPSPRRVLYVDEEMPPQELRRRIQRLSLGTGIEANDRHFGVFSHAGIRVDKVGMTNLARLLKENDFDPDIIIVETVRRVLVGDEKEAKDVVEFWRNLDPIFRAGKTVILSHHMKKPNSQGKNENRYRASGSTDLLGGLETAFALDKKAKDNVVIECVKMREAEEPPPFSVSLDSENNNAPAILRLGGILGDEEKLARACVLIPSLLSVQQAQMAKTNEIHSHLESQGISTTTSERALGILKEQGRIENPGNKKGTWKLAP